MFLSRPLFSLALSVLFGEILLCPELSFSYRFLLFLFYLSYLSMLSRKKKFRIFLLSLFFFCSSSLHFCTVLKHFQKQEKTIESLLPFRCRVIGRITSLSENEKTVKILLQNCTIFSSFSAMPENLTPSQKEKWKARNALSFSKLLLYLDKEKRKTSDFPLYPGDILQGKGQFKGLSPTRNEGEFSFLHYCKGEGIEGLFFLQKIEAIRTVDTPFLKVLHRFRKSISEDLDSLYPEEQSHFLKCLFLGEKASLEKEERNLYREAGISHILAVSGLHLSLLGGGFYSILRVLGFAIAPASFFSLSFYSLLYLPYRSIRLDCSCGSHASYPFSWKKPRKSKRRTVIPLSGTPYAALIQAAYALFHRLSVFLLHPFSPPSSFRAKRKRKAKESLQTMGKGKKKKTSKKTLHTPPRFSPGKSNCALSFLSRSIPPLFSPAIFFSSLCSAPESPSSSPSPAALRSGHFLSIFSSLWTHRSTLCFFRLLPVLSSSHLSCLHLFQSHSAPCHCSSWENVSLPLYALFSVLLRSLSLQKKKCALPFSKKPLQALCPALSSVSSALPPISPVQSGDHGTLRRSGRRFSLSKRRLCFHDR